MAGMLPVDSPLVLLPSSTFCSHIYTGLTGEDRKALRLACKGSRLFVNGEVTDARISGSTLRAGGPTLTLQRVVGTCPQLNCLVLNDTYKDHVCGQLLAEFLNTPRVASKAPPVAAKAAAAKAAQGNRRR